MNNKSYRRDESLMAAEKNENQELDENQHQSDEQILPQENNEVDQLEETQNVTFNFQNTLTFKVEIPDSAKLIALSKYYLEEWKELAKRLEFNFRIAKEVGLIITTEADEQFHEGIQREIKTYLDSIYTQKLALDYDSQRTFFRSNFIQKECQNLQYYIIKQKNSDQNIVIHLASKKEEIKFAASNLEQKLKGLRIFFLDVVNHMTSPKINIDYKNLLGNLRQNYFQKILSDNLEEKFSENLEFIDVIDKQKPFSSCLLGFHFPFDLQGKSLLCQEIYQYISKRINQLFAIFISFNSQGDNIQQARYIENLITNFKQNNKFICVCQVDLTLKVIAILGTPESIKIIVNELLKQKKDDFSKEFIRSFAINMLKKNFEFNPTSFRGSIQMQIFEKLQKKKELEISSQEQLYSIKFISKVTFESYCNLITYICDKKIDQGCEDQLDSDQKRIISKFKDLNIGGKFFQQLEIMPPQNINKKNTAKQFSEQFESNTQNNQKYNQQAKMTQGQNVNFQQKSDKINQQPNSNLIPQSENNKNKQKLDKQSTVDSINDKIKQQEMIQLFVGDNQYLEYQEEVKRISFFEPIVQEIKDATGRIKVIEQYEKYFQQLIGEKEPSTGYICINEKDLMSLKVFNKNIRIYLEHQSVEHQEGQIVIEVKVNGEVQKNNLIYEQEENEDHEKFYMVVEDNQILPYKRL